MIDIDSDDTFFLRTLQIAVRAIIVHCLMTQSPLGGRAKVGPKRVVEVLIWGRTWPPEE